MAIAAVCDIVGAFLWGDEGDSIGDCREQVIESSRGRLPEQRLELGKELLDRIEIWAVRREIADVGPRRGDSFAYTLDLMARQVVHDDNVTGRQARREKLLDIGFEGLPIHRTIEDTGRSQPIASETGDEGGGLPVAPGHA